MPIPSADQRSTPRVRVARRGEPLPQRATLLLEDGTDLGVVQVLPGDVPFGYHRLRGEGQDTLLIVAPLRCPPPERRAWGWAAQLYALRSAESWGIGDLADLGQLGSWSRDRGAGFILLNPLHATSAVPHRENSPYFPSSRRFRDPLYLRIEEVPGAAALSGDLEQLARAGRALNDERRIDRDRVGLLKRDALEQLWRGQTLDERFEQYRATQGDALREWGIFNAIAEERGDAWRAWPAALRDRDPEALTAFADAHADRAAFHVWLQWLLDEQLGRAAREIPVVNDLAVGFEPHGYDAWSWQQLLAPGVSIGAPPDAFNIAGQDWNLPAFDPERLRDAAYEPFIQTLRAAFRHAAGVRIDHVMGLFRLWWVPRGADPAHGAYVRYPSDELLAIVALEAHRANAFVIGEDLGTVEPAVRTSLAQRGILSYRLMLFEGTDVAAYPELALAAVTTHDLPTIAGLWSGADLRRQEAAGLEPNVAGNQRLRDVLATLTPALDAAEPALDAAEPSLDAAEPSLDATILTAYRRLAASPALLVAVTLEDALRVEERPNLPGTTAAPALNWCLALPSSLEEIERDAFVDEVTAAVQRGSVDALQQHQ